MFIQTSEVNLSNCIISNNIVEEGKGGGLHYYNVFDSGLIASCFITENAAIWGGGISMHSVTILSIANSTITQNHGTWGGGIRCEGASPIIFNSIIWSNDPANIRVDAGQPEIMFSDIGGGFEGEGNIDADPLFIPGPGGEYYLSHRATGQSNDSPCIDSGNDFSWEVCFAVWDGELCMDSLTTRTDSIRDLNGADIGGHYIMVDTPTPTPVPTFTPAPTATPRTPFTGVRLDLYDSSLQAGDLFNLRSESRGNPSDLNADLCIVLDVYGDYWFWPSWTPSFDKQRISLAPYEATVTLILSFLWPEGEFGSAENLRFWGAILRPNTLDVIGEIDSVVFGYY